MDHGGAMVGPLLAAGVLALTGDLRLTFALAAVPGIVAVLALVVGVREPPPAAAQTDTRAAVPPPLGRPIRVYLAVLAVFTLGNSTDAFLLLRAQEAGLSLAALPLLWAWHHAVKAAASTHGGALSDRIGRRRTILLGWLVYALTYAGFGVAGAPWQIWALFGVYGLYYALTEGAEKALLADLAPVAARGTAFGAYHALTGAALLPASLLTGWLWQSFGAAAALGLGAALAAVAAAGLWLLVPEQRPA
jgi:MFS family permease